jgi:hypothetical protein
MTIAIDPKTLGPKGRPILTIKHKPPGASQEVSVLPRDPELSLSQPVSDYFRTVSKSKHAGVSSYTARFRLHSYGYLLSFILVRKTLCSE